MSDHSDVGPPQCQTTAMSDDRDVRPIRKRALGVPSARVKIIEPERAKKRPLFLEKRKRGQKDSHFFEVLFKRSQKNHTGRPICFLMLNLSQVLFGGYAHGTKIPLIVAVSLPYLFSEPIELFAYFFQILVRNLILYTNL